MAREKLYAIFIVMAVGTLPVYGDTISLGGTFDGNATITADGSPGLFTQNFAGDGDDNTYGSFTPTSQSLIDFSGRSDLTITDGTMTDVLDDGELFGTTSGSGAITGRGTATFTVDFEVTGGSGIFAGDTGEVTYTGTITRTSLTTESIEGTYTGSISTSPEPSTWPLLASGLGLVVVWGAGRAARHKNPKPV